MDSYTLDEELAAVLWGDIPYINHSNYNDDNNHDSNNNSNTPNSSDLFVDSNNGMAYENGCNFQQTVKSVGKQKRKREGHQIQHHIITERKRRQLLTQRFIALSAILPGLKKIDKTSVLGEAIKYLKQLEEKVKRLEEEQKSTSVMVVKKSKLLVDDDNSLCCADSNASYPEIEVKVSDQTLLLKFHCEKRGGILVRLFDEIEKHSLRIDSCCIIPFGSLALDVTIVAQMENGSDKNVKEIVKVIHSALRY